MLGKKDGQLSFGQMEERRRAPRDHFLRRIDEAVNWRSIEQMLEELYASRRGRPSYPPLIMFKALLLERWYGLSDPGLEEAISDRISFQQFLGLFFEDPVPDETTICKFRGMLAQKGLSEKLFDLMSIQLDAQGLVVRRGSLVDATLLKA
jgi:IS5 family transposase